MTVTVSIISAALISLVWTSSVCARTGFAGAGLGGTPGAGGAPGFASRGPSFVGIGASAAGMGASPSSLGRSGFISPGALHRPFRFGNPRFFLGVYPYWGYGGYGYAYGYEEESPMAEQPDNSYAEWLRKEDLRRIALPRSAFVKNYYWPNNSSRSSFASKAQSAASTTATMGSQARSAASAKAASGAM